MKIPWLRPRRARTREKRDQANCLNLQKLNTAANEQIHRLNATLQEKDSRIKQLEKTILEHQEKIMALACHPSTYAQYLSEKNTTEAQKKLREYQHEQTLRDAKGADEIGLFTSEIPIVDVDKMMKGSA